MKWVSKCVFLFYFRAAPMIPSEIGNDLTSRQIWNQISDVWIIVSYTKDHLAFLECRPCILKKYSVRFLTNFLIFFLFLIFSSFVPIAQHGAWKLDASWHHRSALIKLRLGDFKERNDKVVKYRLTYRRVRYFEDVMRNDNWKKLTNSTFNHTRSVLKLPKIEIYKILLSNASSYEINLSTFFESGRVTSTSVFLDSWNLARSGNI